MKELIERLMRAPFGTVSLDEAVAVVYGYERRVAPHDPSWTAWYSPDGIRLAGAPAFTRDTDAALLLVPDEYVQRHLTMSRGRPIEFEMSMEDDVDCVFCSAATPALAICATVLTARLA